MIPHFDFKEGMSNVRTENIQDVRGRTVMDYVYEAYDVITHVSKNGKFVVQQHHADWTSLVLLGQTEQ
jgi:hypothetical protein